MRRACIATPAAAAVFGARSICEFNFGHPNLSKEYKVGQPASRSVAPGTNKDHGIKVTKLSNGARVITHNNEGPLTTVGAYIEAGAKFDPINAPGLSYAMRWSLLTSNMENSLFQIDRALRSFGASISHSEIRKQYIGLRLDGRTDMWKAPFENLLTGIAAPRFAESDIERFRDTWDALYEEQRWQNPREYVANAVETVAFFKEPLGNPRAMPPKSNDECTHEKLLEQYCKLVIPSRIVIAGVNVDHNDLVAAYENSPYPHSELAPHHRDTKKPTFDFTKEADQFQAGSEKHEFEKRAKAMGTKPYMEEEVIAAVGYKSFGRDNLTDFAAAKVTQALIDAEFNDGLRYEKYETNQGLRSFYRPFGTAGLLGFTIRTSPTDVVSQIIAAHKSLQKIDAGAALDGAKARATAAFYNEELETQREYCDFLGTSLGANGTSHTSVDAIVGAISKVTQADVKRVVSSMFAQKPALFATGDVMQFPSLRQLGL